MSQAPAPGSHSPPDANAQDLLAIARTLSGDRRAFAGIVQRYTSPLFSLALRLLGDRGEAEEAVQEIFLKAFRSLGRFEMGRRFHPWLYTIALNHVRSLARKIRRQRRGIVLSSELDARPDLGSVGPERRAALAEGERLAAQALGALPPRLREVFVLRQIEGLAVREVAEILGVPAGTIKTHLHRARRRLARLLAARGWEPET